MQIKALNAVQDGHNRCPGYTFLDTSGRPDVAHGVLGALKPDVCCYTSEHAELVSKDGRTAPTVMGYAALFIEVKKKPELDAFNDPIEDADLTDWKFVLDTRHLSVDDRDQTRRAFGQNVVYAAEILARQHRHALYSITLSGSIARFIRWDRAGALVTAAFDIRKYPEYLCDFLWCFSLTTDAVRGYDLTVEVAHSTERALFLAAIKAHIPGQAGVGFKNDGKAVEEACRVHYVPGQVTAIRIPEEHSMNVRRFLVSRPLTYPLSAFGRGSRLYWAVEITADGRPKVVLLKDTWRVDPPPSGCTEGATLESMRAAGVAEYLPDVLYHGDVIQRDAVPKPFEDKTIRMTMKENGMLNVSFH